MNRILITLGFAALASSALAADPVVFKTADKNNDGKLTWEEVHAVLPAISDAQFKAADKDKNGTLGDAEYATLPGAAK